MKKKFTVAVASLAATAVAVVPASAAGSFTDVAENNAHFDAIVALHKAGIINGYPDGTFKPAQDVTRGQAAKMIVGALGLDTKNVTNPNFTDLPVTHHYYSSIAALAALDAVEKKEKNLVAPNETVTRGEIAYMLAQALKLKAEGTNPFEDAPADSDYASYVTALYENGIANGVSETKFGVDESITRGQLATFIFNVMNKFTEDDATEVVEPTEPAETTEDTALLDTVFTKATEKQLATNSMKATMTMTQSMEIKEGDELINVDTSGKLDMSMINKPLQFFIDGTMSMTEPTTGESMDIPLKMYMTEKDGIYMYDGLTKAWTKLPADMYAEILAQSGAQMNATDQLNMLRQFASDFTIEETDKYYTLRLTGTGDAFTALVQEQLSAMNLGLGDEVTAELQNLKYDNITYSIKVNKETFDIEEMFMEFGFGMNMDNVVMNVKSAVTMKYFDFNKVTTITIPAEAIENATSLEDLTNLQLETE